MKTAICYYSHHHGNTMQVLEAMAQEQEIDLINVTSRIAAHLERILPGGADRAPMLEGYAEVQRGLGDEVAPDNAGRIMIDKLSQR